MTFARKLALILAIAALLALLGACSSPAPEEPKKEIKSIYIKNYGRLDIPRDWSTEMKDGRLVFTSGGEVVMTEEQELDVYYSEWMDSYRASGEIAYEGDVYLNRYGKTVAVTQTEKAADHSNGTMTCVSEFAVDGGEASRMWLGIEPSEGEDRPAKYFVVWDGGMTGDDVRAMAESYDATYVPPSDAAQQTQS